MAFELDPARSALIIQDLQNDVIAEGGAFADSGAPAHAQSQNVAENVKSLAEAARKAGMAVIHVHYIVEEGAPGLKLNAPLFRGVAEAKALVRGTWGAAAVAGLEPQAGDLVVEKMRMNAFHDTHLETILKGLGVDTIVISGAWTNFSVEHTARHGADAGYRAVVLTDGNLHHQRRVAQRRPQLRSGEHRRARDLRRGRSSAWRLNASRRQSTRGREEVVAAAEEVDHHAHVLLGVVEERRVVRAPDHVLDGVRDVLGESGLPGAGLAHLPRRHDVLVAADDEGRRLDLCGVGPVGPSPSLRGRPAGRPLCGLNDLECPGSCRPRQGRPVRRGISARAPGPRSTRRACGCRSHRPPRCRSSSGR